MTELLLRRRSAARAPVISAGLGGVLASVALLACAPASRVDIGARGADAAAHDADSATSTLDAHAPSADSASPSADAAADTALDGPPGPGTDAAGADARPGDARPGDALPETHDARLTTGDAALAPGDALPPPADAFVHMLPETGHPDAAVSLEMRLALCDEDPVLAGVVADDEGWGHVPAGTEVNYTHNPPASGPHYGQWTRSGVYAEAIDRRNWVHNLEHGWMVLLHRPDAPAADVRVLTDAYAAGFPDEQCPDSPVRRLIVTPDPLLPTPVAAVTAYRLLAGDHLTTEQLAHLFAACRVGAPELRACGDGQVPAPPSMAP